MGARVALEGRGGVAEAKQRGNVLGEERPDPAAAFVLRDVAQLVPQQPPFSLPWAARVAASPYFCWMTSFKDCSLMIYLFPGAGPKSCAAR